MKDPLKERREVKTRQTPWAQSLACFLLRKGVRPNDISLASMLFAVLAGVFLFLRIYLGAALCIQLRLLCNMLDGMLAIEGKAATKTGEVFNELPDRVSDSVILISAGSAALSPYAWLGWIAAFFALSTAYIRLLGYSVTGKMYFNGPLAKPQRMFVLTLGCLLAPVFAFWTQDAWVITIALIFITAGSLITCLRRLIFIIKELEAK